MRCFPIDTFENNRTDASLLHRDLFAYPPHFMDNNDIRDYRWWNIPLFFRRTFREASSDFRLAKNTKRDLEKMK